MIRPVSDLHRFREQTGKQFAALVALLDQHQSRTDVLDALEAARQELDSLPSGTNSKLVVTSDFLEDDGVYRFISDSSLASSAHAHELDLRLRKQHDFALPAAPLCFTCLERSGFVYPSPSHIPDEM